MTFDYSDGKFVITIRTSKARFSKCLDVVKHLRGKYFDGKTKRWMALATRANYSALLDAHFQPSALVADLFDTQYSIPDTPQAYVDEEQLPRELRPYQKDGVRFLEATRGRGIIAFDPRLGKSSTAACWIKLHPRLKKTLIICPANAKIGWHRELIKWLGEDASIIWGLSLYDLPQCSFYIINYDILSAWVNTLADMCFDVLIVDECQYLANVSIRKKNEETGKTETAPVQRTEAFFRLAQHTPHIIPLSGTPITKYPAQFEPILRAIRPDLFPDRQQFLWEYCAPRHNGYTWIYDGATNISKLRSKLALCMFRKRKEDVLSDLPEQEAIIVPLSVDRKAYEKDFSLLCEWQQTHPEASEEETGHYLSLMQSIAYDAKRSQIYEWVDTFLQSGEPLVVFCWHRAVCEDLYQHYKQKAVLVYGGIDAKKRQQAIDTFQESDTIQVFIGQYKACNTAISLSRASVVACVELPFTPGDLKQAQERIFIPNDGKERLTYYYLVAADTVDEARALSLEERARNVSLILDGVTEDAVLGQRVKTALRR